MLYEEIKRIDKEIEQNDRLEYLKSGKKSREIDYNLFSCQKSLSQEMKVLSVQLKLLECVKYFKDIHWQQNGK